MKKLLLLDNNFSSRPLLNTSHQHDFEQHYCGRERGYQIGDASAKYWDINYSDDAEVIRLIREQKFDALIPGCSDLSYLIGSKMAEKFSNFSGFDSTANAELISNKDKFRTCLLSLGLPSPVRLSLDNACTVPKIIIKPVDSYSGQGITVLAKTDIEKVNAAIIHAQAHSPSEDYLIEEFVSGQLYSHSAFIQKGEIKADFVVEEHCISDSFRVDTSWVIKPEDCPFLEQLRDSITKFVQELGLVDGLIHTQFIAESKNFWIIEMMRRSPGDLYSQLIYLSTGFDYCDAYIQPFLRSENVCDVNLLPNNVANDMFVVRHTMHVKPGETFRDIKLSGQCNPIQIVPLRPSHTLVKKGQDTRAAIFFFSMSDKAQFNHLVSLIQNQKLYSLI